ncbi:DNA-processing protein DprA [Flavitalea flava]
MEKELLYRLALTRVPGIGPVFAKTLFNHFGEAEAIFREAPEMIQKINGVGPAKAKAIAAFRDFHSLENELRILEKYKMRCLFFTDKEYPRRLLPIKEAPAILFFRGDADLNTQKIISVVGTRSPTEYGKQAITSLLKELQIPGLLIVSGLAFGIDAASHQAALDSHIPTVAVLGHGFNQIYPAEHTGLAKKMIKEGGGLLTQFGFHTNAEQVHFPQRNKIVAGICDVLIVVETNVRGGSMLTVQNAIDYKKRIFAFPGRVTDPRSSGCNDLIGKGNARMFINAPKFLEEMNWTEGTNILSEKTDSFRNHAEPLRYHTEPTADQIAALSNEENLIYRLLQQKGSMSIDNLLVQGNLSNGATALALLTLELKELIRSLPGKMYSLKHKSQELI